MAIVKMKKLTLAAPINQRDNILNLLLKESSVHVLNLKELDASLDENYFFSSSKAITKTEADLNNIKFTYEFLKKYLKNKEGLFTKKEVVLADEFDEFEDKVDWKNICENCKNTSKAIEDNRGKKLKALSSIELYKEWVNLDISYDDIKCLKYVEYFIGTINVRYKDKLVSELYEMLDDTYIEEISVKNQNLNLFILCHKNDYQKVTELLKKYSFTKSGLDFEEKAAYKVNSLSSILEELDIEYDRLKEKAEKLSLNIKIIEKSYDFLSTRQEIESSISKLVKTQKTFILSGWVPEYSTVKLKSIIEHKTEDAFVVFEDPKDGEEPPVKLKNNSFIEPFEVITSLYSLPLPTEVDPTPILAPFFMLFFGMMMADIGYGIVMAIVAVFMMKYTNIEGGMKKIVKLILYCSVPTVIFGLLYGSFFGGIIELKPLWVSPVDNTIEVLVVSIAIGIIHIFTGLGVKAYQLIKSGHILDAVYDVLFWYGLISGLIWMLLGGKSGAQIIASVSALGLLLTQGRGNKTLAGKFFGGLYGLYGITSYLGDALSYSRLLALGLASGLIGWAFNLLIKMLGSGVIAFVFGVLIFIAGHTFNFLIGGLGTFVHTCRLEYLEFFGKFYQGGGKAFEPLRIKTKFIRLNTEK